MATESKKTVSRCTTEAAQGTHTFQIVGYSLKKGIGVGNFVRSGTFAVGGYHWAIRFYPDGFIKDTEEHVSVYLEFMSENAEARAFYTLTLVNIAATVAPYNWGRDSPRLFNSSDANRFGPKSPAFILRSELELEGSGYIVDDRLTIECELTVVKESQVSETMGCNEIEVPRSDLSDHVGKLLEEEEGRDVAFSVGGLAFTAHKIVLAARSPVFKAELYGEMKERRESCITIKDMQPAVFETLLHFIYTDLLPDMVDFEGDEYGNMIRHLLVAADRYAMDRLKLMCQSILGKHLNVENVATTLALADKHNCDRLKDVCIQLIASSNKIDALTATEGYASLKRTCPSVLVDLFEKASRFRNT